MTEQKPLSGVRVLDLSRLIPGPFATMVLRDLGAQIDKIEDGGAGDYLRHMPPHVAGMAAAFHTLNRGKRSAAIDLKQPAGREALLRLLGHYDVLFEQFRPGVLDRLGLSHASLRERYPRLIICALTGYGQSGPMKDRAGHDINYLARSGLLSLQGPAGGPPQVPAFQMADVSGGLWSVIAILAALRERDQTGQGRVCDVAMTDGLQGFAALSMTGALAGHIQPRGQEALTGGIAPYGCYLAKDDVPVTIGALEPKFWMRFCAATGLEADGTALIPGPHQVELKQKLSDIFASKTGAEWEAFAATHDCCVQPALSPQDLLSDEHAIARRQVVQHQYQGAEVPQLSTPVSAEAELCADAPRRGQHTRAMLSEAGFSDPELDALLASGAIQQHD